MATKRKPATKKKSASKLETIKSAPRHVLQMRDPIVKACDFGYPTEMGNTPVCADRFNTGKPELSYVLTFAGAAELMDLPERIQTLAEWYQDGDRTRLLELAFQEAVEELGFEAFTIGVARVAAFGAQKYARGNYLLGRGWSCTCDSLIRHALASLAVMDEIDEDSGLAHVWHEAWNWCYLHHCVATMPERDDRVRAFKSEGGE